MTSPRLQLSGITKRYPGVIANSDVSLTLMPGQTHAVLGENGAGKSTLMKIIYGSVKPDAGHMMLNGQLVHIRNPKDARANGISMVFQHFNLFDTMTVAENVWLGLTRDSLEQVTASMSQISELAIESADGSQLSARACEQLFDLALGLQNMVARFDVGQRDAGQRDAGQREPGQREPEENKQLLEANWGDAA